MVINVPVQFGTRTVAPAITYTQISVTVSFAAIQATGGGGGGGGTWGSITGTLSNQTDLQAALDGKASVLALNAHVADTANPHSVTKTQVGLGNVDNTSDADKPISTATQTALDAKADETDLTNHVNDTSNPHSVTASQVGLGNVDNTSDLNKPISTATQSALDAKANNELTFNTQTDSYILALSDAGNAVVINAATAKTLTVPLNSSVAFPVGTQILFYQLGAGQVTITPAGGVTLLAPDGALKTRVVNSPVTLLKYATDTWFVSGDLNV